MRSAAHKNQEDKRQYGVNGVHFVPCTAEKVALTFSHVSNHLLAVECREASHYHFYAPQAAMKRECKTSI